MEHPYGTIKRQWGFSYIMTKRFIKRAEADVGMMFTAYNLRRMVENDLAVCYIRQAGSASWHLSWRRNVLAYPAIC